MQEATQHLLDGVVGLTCVDPSLHPMISAAPFVGSIIAQQSVYVCHVASASFALFGRSDSAYWRALRRVAAARERRVAALAPAPPNLSILSGTPGSPRSPASPADPASPGGPGGPDAPDGPGGPGGPNDPDGSSDLDGPDDPGSPGDPDGPGGPDGPGCSARCSPLPARAPRLSPLEFRVVVLGGGRVGRQIVERLLREPALVHPSRITIVTRQPEAVADFVSCGVMCTGRTEGREALEACHVLIIACQQAQFDDFVTIYCPRVHRSKRAAETLLSPETTPSASNETGRRTRGAQRRRRMRTLRDVVDKWRVGADEEDDNNDGRATIRKGKNNSNASRPQSLLSPETFVFSCCAALGSHKIAKEIGHLAPLVVRADVDFSTVHAAAAHFRDAQDAHRDAFIQRVTVEDNAFLTMLHTLQQSPVSSSGESVARRRAPPNMQSALSGDGVSGGTHLLLQVWRALRCAAVVREASLAQAQQRTFLYLQRVGPMLGAVLVALPRDSQCGVLDALEKEIARKEEDDDDEEEAAGKGKPLVMLERRVIAAYDSDDDGDEHDGMPPHTRELARLVECFPEIFSSAEVALQQLREYFTVVTSPAPLKVQ